jgi:hypothetical protein
MQGFQSALFRHHINFGESTMPPVVNLNADFIAHHLQCPDDKKQIEYVDNARSGLYVLVSRTSPGRGTYYERYKNAAGKTCHRKLGRTEDISLTEAKAMNKKLKGPPNHLLTSGSSGERRKELPALNENKTAP